MAEIAAVSLKTFFTMLKKNVNQRYESAEEILEELNVQIDRPTIVINNVDREGKIETRMDVSCSNFLGVIAIFVPMLNQQDQIDTPNDDKEMFFK